MAANEASPAARTAALFPGQGVQRPGLGAPWSTSRAWELVEEVSQAADPALCLAQLTGPVHWHGVLDTLRDTAGCARLLDVGPGRTMAGLARRAVPELAVQRADQLLPSPV
ncbi:hypothetical protein OG746_40170 [Streptomyces sp. NBC_01016]|uniref:hypothetical protein n=1 Tax=Streptomyces sp. NBC_01016 TaxID=2903720 RepID=UPI00224CFF31|nr:hypothetical protein [Streptomyces sp. NBC_01016]MCX4834919.1 hypothetical protein [Streptomyces sp. NBC_01016]